MARRRYRRYRRRSGRWAPNIIKVSDRLFAPSGEWGVSEDLAVNPIQVNTGVSQTYTVKNFEISFSLETATASGGYLESITIYVMYVPQGMAVSSSYYAEHPEYIMAYKYIGSPGVISTTNSEEGQQYQPIKIRSRLSRKLQTGDKVILFVQGSNEYSSSVQFNIDGIVRWWSKAN